MKAHVPGESLPWVIKHVATVEKDWVAEAYCLGPGRWCWLVRPVRGTGSVACGVAQTEAQAKLRASVAVERLLLDRLASPASGAGGWKGGA